MQTIQILLDEPLLRAADRAARKASMNRSALVREALRSYLRMLELREKERQDRVGYERHPEDGAVPPPDKSRPVLVLTRDLRLI